MKQQWAVQAVPEKSCFFKRSQTKIPAKHSATFVLSKTRQIARDFLKAVTRRGVLERLLFFIFEECSIANKKI